MSRPSLGYSNYYWIRQDQKKAEAKAKANELELQDDTLRNLTEGTTAANPNNPPNLEEKPQDSWKPQHDSLAVNQQNKLESGELAAALNDSPETLPVSLVKTPPETQESFSSLPDSLETPVIPAAVSPSFPLVNQITSWKPQTDSEK